LAEGINREKKAAGRMLPAAFPVSSIPKDTYLAIPLLLLHYHLPGSKEVASIYGVVVDSAGYFLS
jgi:hypothetical protein